MSGIESNVNRATHEPVRQGDAAPESTSAAANASTDDSGRENLAHFLIFVGRLVAIAGGLAMIRLWTFDWFYAALIPIGIGMTIAGARIRRRIAMDKPPVSKQET